MTKRKYGREEVNEENVALTADESKRIGSAIIAADPEQVGKSLVRTATERSEKGFMEQVLARVQELVTHRSNLYIALEKLQREIALFDKRIAAVEAGEFQIDRNGRLQFNDILLNY